MSRGQLTAAHRGAGARRSRRRAWPRKTHPRPGGLDPTPRGTAGPPAWTPARARDASAPSIPRSAPVDSLRTAGIRWAPAAAGGHERRGRPATGLTRPGDRASPRAGTAAMDSASVAKPTKQAEQAPPGPATPRAPARHSGPAGPRRQRRGMRCGMPPSSSALRASASGPTAYCRAPACSVSTAASVSPTAPASRA